MIGLAAIQEANGWAMAGTGACIVLCGLAVLSFLISMIPRFTGILEKKSAPSADTSIESKRAKMMVPETLPDDIDAAATLFIALTEDLGKDFTLFDLHKKSKELDLPHPHLLINRFRYADILISVENERFAWQHTAE